MMYNNFIKSHTDTFKAIYNRVGKNVFVFSEVLDLLPDRGFLVRARQRALIHRTRKKHGYSYRDEYQIPTGLVMLFDDSK